MFFCLQFHSDSRRGCLYKQAPTGHVFAVPVSVLHAGSWILHSQVWLGDNLNEQETLESNSKSVWCRNAQITCLMNILKINYYFHETEFSSLEWWEKGIEDQFPTLKANVLQTNEGPSNREVYGMLHESPLVHVASGKVPVDLLGD